MIQELLQQANTEEVKWYVNNVMKKAIEKDNLDQITAEHVIDFLNSDRSPKRLRKMAIQDAIRKAEDWTKSLIKKAANIIETEEDLEVIKRWKSTGLSLVKLVGKAAFDREGKLMRQCVASYYGKNGSEIYSIRDDANNPHATIEVLKSNGQINQIKGKGNGPIHPKYIHAVLKSLKLLGFNVRESELENLGYTKYSDEAWKLIMEKTTGAKYLTFNNTKFLYNYSKLTLKDNDNAI